MGVEWMIFEILPGTPQNEGIHKVFNWDKQFTDEFQKEFKEQIGVEFNGNCSTNPHRLLLERIPEGQEKQFCKELQTGKKCMFYVARENSKLNKAFKALIEKYNIQEYRILHFSLQYIEHSAGLAIKEYSQVFERYFIHLKNDYDERLLPFFRSAEWLKEIPESEYLRLRADYLDHLERS
jgi:hypothetical protein